MDRRRGELVWARRPNAHAPCRCCLCVGGRPGKVQEERRWPYTERPVIGECQAAGVERQTETDT